MEEQAQKIAELLKLLANKNRLLILCALTHGKQHVGEIHTHLPDITASALSQHLRQLKAAGILAAEKQGMHVLYWIADKRVLSLMETLQDNYCT